MNDLLFDDWKNNIKTKLGTSEWVQVYAQDEVIKDVNQGGIYCGLIPNKKVKDILSDYQWDLRIGSGKPGFSSFSGKRGYISKYARMCTDGIEPLIHWRSFPDRKGYIEISEEFRLYFDLLEERKEKYHSNFIHFDDNGDEELVAKVTSNQVEIKLKFLKEYLAVRKMHLAIYFDLMRFSNKTISELGLSEIDEVTKEDNFIFSHLVRHIHLQSYITQSWLLGKKIITPQRDFKYNFLGKKTKKEFEKFIIGIDSDGNQNLYTCEEEKLANFFGKNKGKPFSLTPVFFRKEVLSKYYNDPTKYSVEDGLVSRKGFWSLRIDNNHTEMIMAYLVDLGKLSHKEQLYWKSFNVAYQGGISRVAWERNFEGKFSDPDSLDLFFKSRFSEFQDSWFAKHGWYLYKPLNKEDIHHLSSLHTPAANNQKEFDDQILSLTKIMIDSLNEKELVKDIEIKKENAKGLDKLSAFLDNNGINQKKMMEFLRNLQTLRSTSVAHRKSEGNKDYQKAIVYFELDNKEFNEAFSDILIKCIWTINYLYKHLLKKNE